MAKAMNFIIALICATAALAAGDKSEWASEGDWTILVDESAGNGCLMQKDFDDGLRVRFGFYPARSGGFFSALNKNWTDIAVDTTGTVKFITDEAKFAGDVELIEEDGWYGGWAFFNNPNLTVEIAKRRSITVIGPKGGTFEVDLSGTSRAIALMEECQAAQP